MSVPASRLQEERLRLQRAREQAENREYLARLNAEQARLHQQREQEARRRQQQHELRLERERARNEARRSSAGAGASQFTPPQSFIAGYAASRVPGAPAFLDIAIAVGAAAVATAWVATRDHATGGDVGWSAFLFGLGVILAVEGHAEAHDAGIGLLGSQAGYLTDRLIGGAVQPGQAA
jgi:hypothetical protein